ncbi:MAG: trigger factor, partial [Oligoflexia bacterium]|nr:trigger factor [Oligoflexia bacterium]
MSASPVRVDRLVPPGADEKRRVTKLIEDTVQYDLQIEELSPIRRRLRFTVPADHVRSELDTAYSGLKKRARIPGFRPGKATRKVLEARFGKQVTSDVSARLIEQAFREAALDLDVAGQPALEEQGPVTSSAELTFVIGVDIKPQVELSDYRGLRVAYPAVEVRDVDVDAAVNRLLQGQSRIAEVTQDRPVELGDRVLAALKLTAGDEVLADDAGTMILTQGERFYPGVETLLLGLKKGDKKSETVSIDASSQIEKLQGQEVLAEVEVLGMQTMVVPELSDDLAAELKYEGGAEGMRAALRMRLQEQADEASRNEARVALLQQLVVANGFAVPEGMIDEQFQALVEELKVRRAYAGQDPRSIRFTDAEVSDLRGRALFAARASVILSAVARQEGIEVADGDLDAKIAEIAESRGQQVEAIRAYLQREQAFDVLRTRIMEEKTLEWLLEASELVPTDPAEMEAAAAEAAEAADAAEAALEAALEAAADAEAVAEAAVGAVVDAAAAAAAEVAAEAAAEPAAVEPAAAAEAPAEPVADVHWTKSMKKAELLAVAAQLGLTVNTKNTKAQ